MKDTKLPFKEYTVMSNNLIQNLNCSDVYRTYTLLLTADKDSLETNTTLKQLAGFVGEELDNYKKSKSTLSFNDKLRATGEVIIRYGLVSLDKNFTALKNLEYLDLSSNNFQKVPEEINPTNFPKLRTLNMGANTRKNIYDLSNTIETNYGGLVEEQGFPRRLIEWDLDTLVLSVNYLQGPLPKMDDWEKYTEQDIIDADTLPRALIGPPR